MTEFLFVGFAFCVAVAMLAKRFDRNPVEWFLLSIVVSPLLSGIILLIKGQNGKTCPRCAETVKSAATRCRYCGHDFAFTLNAPATLNAAPTPRPARRKTELPLDDARSAAMASLKKSTDQT